MLLYQGVGCQSCINVMPTSLLAALNCRAVGQRHTNSTTHSTHTYVDIPAQRMLLPQAAARVHGIDPPGRLAADGPCKQVRTCYPAAGHAATERGQAGSARRLPRPLPGAQLGAGPSSPAGCPRGAELRAPQPGLGRAALPAPGQRVQGGRRRAGTGTGTQGRAG